MTYLGWVTQLEKFSSAKDFFEFTVWLRNFVEKNQGGISGGAMELIEQKRKEKEVKSPVPARLKTLSINSSSSMCEGI